MSTATCAVEAEATALMQALTEVDITRLPWPEAPPAQVMEVMRFLLDGSLTERPKRERATREDRKNLAWCFLAGQDFRPMAVRTFSTLEEKVRSGALYFTPNTFYSRRSKTANGLRWLNAVYIDLDDPELTLPDVLEAVAEVGLPSPTLMAKTPNGMHAYWKLKPVRATERAVRCYTALLRAVARALRGDLRAATPERFLRVPRQLLYFTRTEYKLQDFVGWHKSWESEEKPQNTGDGRGRKAAVVAKDILLQPAIVELLWKGVEKGRRNCTCFTLALALKVARCSYEDAIVLLRNWNQRNLPPLSDTEVVRTVHSAYSGRYRGPRAEMVRYLSGQEFRYRVFSPRECTGRPRGRPRKQETVREKFLQLLEDAGGVLTTRESRSELAQKVGCSRSTLNAVVASLVREGRLDVRIRRLGKGYGAEVAYRLAAREQAACTESYNTLKNVIHVGGGGRVGPRAADEARKRICQKRWSGTEHDKRTGRSGG